MKEHMSKLQEDKDKAMADYLEEKMKCQQLSNKIEKLQEQLGKSIPNICNFIIAKYRTRKRDKPSFSTERSKNI